jgi:hypothetical protein
MGGGKQSGSEQLRTLPIAPANLAVEHASRRQISRFRENGFYRKKKDRLGLWGGKGGRSTKHPKALGCS